MSDTAYRLLAIVVANGGAGLAVRIVERKLPELRGALVGLYLTFMLFGFSFFFRDRPVLWVAPLFLFAAVTQLHSVRKRLLSAKVKAATR